jgi:hypothetical protein
VLINAAFKDPEVLVRAEAVSVVRFRSLSPFIAAVQHALQNDKEESLRIQIVTMLIGKRKEDPTLVDSLLEETARSDPSADVRKLASDGLARPV